MIDREKICKFHYDEINRKYGAEPYEYGEDIVRCKECKHYDTDMWAEKGTYWCGRISDWGNCKYVNADDFCSRGKRREP